MQRKDLKVGETYAVFSTPGQARGRHRRSYDKPFKATLVSLGDTLVIREYQEIRRSDGQLFDRQETRSGIIVEVAPFERTTRKFSLMRGYGDLSPAAQKFWDRVEKRETTETVTQIALENAGCFVMTWAEYEAEQAENKRWDEKRERERQERIERETAGEAEAIKRVERTRELLRESFGKETPESNWMGVEDEKFQPRHYTYAADRIVLKVKRSDESKRVTGAKLELTEAQLLTLLGEEV